MDNSVFEKRLKEFREKLQQKNMDAALVSKRENYIYLSGFTGSTAQLVITPDDALLVTDFRYAEQAVIQAPLFEVVQYRENLIQTINEILKSKNIKKLGFEEHHLTYDKYCEYVSKLGMDDLAPLEGIIEGLRITKDQDEVGIIKTAVKIADKAFYHILKFIKPGIAEIEIAAELEYYMRKLGARGASFETIVASGKRSSMPHGSASEKKLRMGDVIILDYGALYNEYCSDITRTVFLGKPDGNMKEVYNIVLEAQLTALEGLKAGLTGKEIDGIARDVIAGKGYEKNFGHGLGHGVGLEIHEEPRLSPSGGIKTENGMVVTVEPGIYITGYGGVRIEDMVVICGNGPLVLTGSTKEIIVI